jgi:hypothetical protein
VTFVTSQMRCKVIENYFNAPLFYFLYYISKRSPWATSACQYQTDLQRNQDKNNFRLVIFQALKHCGYYMHQMFNKKNQRIFPYRFYSSVPYDSYNKQGQPTDLYNTDTACFLWDSNWVLQLNVFRRHSCFKGLLSPLKSWLLFSDKTLRRGSMYNCYRLSHIDETLYNKNY